MVGLGGVELTALVVRGAEELEEAVLASAVLDRLEGAVLDRLAGV